MEKKTIIGTMFIISAIFLGVLIYGIESSANDNTKELQFVHVVVRHGARTPADTYPKDPYFNESFYPVGWGQLTNTGKLDLYNLGKWLRTRYDTFLGPKYSPQTFYTQSTDVDRTKASAQLINAGLWPPDEDQKWGPLAWQPIPVHSEPLPQDSLLLVRQPCPKYREEFDKLVASEEIQQKLAENSKLFKELSELTGNSIKNFDDVQDLFSTLKAEEGFNLTLPEWTKEYYPSKMEAPTIFSFVLNAYNTQLNRLKGGVLLKKLVKDWKEKRNDTNKRRIELLVGHDSTIVNILSSLKIWDPQLPGYGITILFEFSKDTITEVHGVEVFLRNTTTTLHQLTIPGCGEFCPLDKLIEINLPVIPENWDEECKSDNPKYQNPSPDLKGP